MTFLLTDLPTELLQKVLIYAASDTKTLLNCEKTCHRLCNVVEDDKTWQCIPVIRSLASAIPTHLFDTVQPLPLSFFSSRREYACVTNAIRMSWREQQHSENIIIQVLGAAGFHDLIQDDETICEQSRSNVIGILEEYDGIDLESHRFSVRRDTLHTLVELVQEAMIGILRQAHEMACTFAYATDTYPKLTIQALYHGGKSFLHDFVLQPTVELILQTPGGLLVERDFYATAGRLVSEPVRDKIIQRLAHRAGVIRMDNEVLELAWGTLIHITRLLLRPACVEMIGSMTDCSQGGERELRVLASNETIRNVPPVSTIGICTSCHTASYMHTLVPQQIETAAKSLGLPCKVYGDYWLIQGGCVDCEMYWEASRDTLMEEAEQDYEFEDDDGEEEELDLDMQYYDDDENVCLCTAAPRVMRTNGQNAAQNGDAQDGGTLAGGSDNAESQVESNADDEMSDNNAENDFDDDLEEDFVEDFVDLEMEDSTE